MHRSGYGPTNHVQQVHTSTQELPCNQAAGTDGLPENGLQNQNLFHDSLCHLVELLSNLLEPSGLWVVHEAHVARNLVGDIALDAVDPLRPGLNEFFTELNTVKLNSRCRTKETLRSLYQVYHANCLRWCAHEFRALLVTLQRV